MIYEQPRNLDFGIRSLTHIAIAAIRRWSGNKDWHLQRVTRALEHRYKTLYGKTYFGKFLRCDLTDFIDKRIFLFSIWEPNVTSVFEGRLGSGDYVVDIGANIGYNTLLASTLVGSHGKVISIEASPVIFEKLSHNLSVNNIDNVRAINVAVSDRPGELTLYTEDGNSGRTSSTVGDRSKVVGIVPAMPLDEILTIEERSKIKFIKVDIEGGEVPLMERLVETLDLYPADMSILVEISEDMSGRATSVFAQMMQLGFRAFAVENDYSLSSYLQRLPVQSPRQISELPGSQIDVLFVR